MSAVDLLPCPFCGGEAAMKNGGPGNHWAQCGTCFASTNDHEFDRAIAAWNLRAPVSADAVPVKPLVWIDLGADYWSASAPLFGSIRIEPWGDRGFHVLWSAPGVCDRLIKDLFETPEAAKAAAQADFAARIRSQIGGA